jgi:hypothetical protein
VVIKGGARGGPVALAAHLERTDTNERVTVRELRGVTARNLLDALREMDSMGAPAESRRTLYHANIDTRIGEEMTREQKTAAVERLAAKLGLEDQPRAVVEHVKKGREHLHVVFMRIDLEKMVAISDSHNYRKHEEVSRELEREFGHQRVQGAHVERDGQKRPARTPAHSEMQQAGRTGLHPDQAKARVTELWNQSDTGRAFAAALENDGWTLARGDRRDFVIVDRAGETHSLSKRIEGARAAQVRQRMADIDAATLPSAEEARALQRDRARTQSQAREPAAPPVAAMESDVPILKVDSAPSYRPRPEQPLETASEPLLEADREWRKPTAPVVASDIPEATQRPSVEAQTATPPPKPEKIEEQKHRPAPAMFRQLYTVAADITHKVIEKARHLFEREKDSIDPTPPEKPPAPMGKLSRSTTPEPPPPPEPPPKDIRTPAQITTDRLRALQERERKERPRLSQQELQAMLDRSKTRDHRGPEL